MHKAQCGNDATKLGACRNVAAHCVLVGAATHVDGKVCYEHRVDDKMEEIDKILRIETIGKVHRVHPLPVTVFVGEKGLLV